MPIGEGLRGGGMQGIGREGMPIGEGLALKGG